MLGHPRIPRYWPWASDNATGADNQQERLIGATDENPQRPYARRLNHQAKIWSHLHGDMQGGGCFGHFRLAQVR